MHGGKDNLVPIASVEKLTQKLAAQKTISVDYRVIESADHFFMDDLNILNNHIEDYLDTALSTEAA